MNYEYTEQILLRIKERARIGVSLQELAVELGLEWSLFLSDYLAQNSTVNAHYNAGIAQGRQATLDKTFTLARGGSVQAAQEYHKQQDIQQRKDFLKQMREL